MQMVLLPIQSKRIPRIIFTYPDEKLWMQDKGNCKVCNSLLDFDFDTLRNNWDRQYMQLLIIVANL